MTDMTNAYFEVTKADFNQIAKILGATTGKDITDDMRKQVNDILYNYDRSQKKPKWLVGDEKAQAIFWKSGTIIRGRE